MVFLVVGVVDTHNSSCTMETVIIVTRVSLDLASSYYKTLRMAPYLPILIIFCDEKYCKVIWGGLDEVYSNKPRTTCASLRSQNLLLLARPCMVVKFLTHSNFPRIIVICIFFD